MNIMETRPFYSKDEVEIRFHKTGSNEVQIVISDDEQELKINASLQVCKKLKKKLSKFLRSTDV